MNKNYFISKDNKNGEVVYLEYNKNGYNVKPKVKKEETRWDYFNKWFEENQINKRGRIREWVI